MARIQARELRDGRFDDDLNALLVSLPAGAAAGSGAVSARIAGEWIADVEYPWGVKVTERFSLEADGDELTGSATFLTGVHPLKESEWLPDGARFTTHSDEVLGDQARRVTHRYRLRLDGDTLHLRLQSTGGFSNSSPLKFTARRA